MSIDRQDFIAGLTADLHPVQPRRPLRLALIWLVAAALFGSACLLALGPFRSGALADLRHSARFLGEAVAGLVAVMALGTSGLRLAVPAVGLPLRRAAPALLALAAWLALLLLDLAWPALPPSMAGKRPHCLVEGLVLGAATLMAGLAMARRLWPLRGAWCGALLGLAAGALPALLMQFACTAMPVHALLFHLVPALAMGGVGSVLGMWCLRPR